MTRGEIGQRVLAIIDDRGLTPKEGGEVTEATSFKDDLNTDSLDGVEVIM